MEKDNASNTLPNQTFILIPVASIQSVASATPQGVHVVCNPAQSTSKLPRLAPAPAREARGGGGVPVRKTSSAGKRYSSKTKKSPNNSQLLKSAEVSSDMTTEAIQEKLQMSMNRANEKERALNAFQLKNEQLVKKIADLKQTIMVLKVNVASKELKASRSDENVTENYVTMNQDKSESGVSGSNINSATKDMPDGYTSAEDSDSGDAESTETTNDPQTIKAPTITPEMSISEIQEMISKYIGTAEEKGKKINEARSRNGRLNKKVAELRETIKSLKTKLGTPMKRSRVINVPVSEKSAISGQMTDKMEICIERSDIISTKKAVPVQVCRICLDSDVKLVPIQKYQLETAYEEMTGVILDEDILPKYLCVECAQRLINCSRFRQKSCRAYLTLVKMAERNEDNQLTWEQINSVNRNELNLISNLGTTFFKDDHYDFIMTHAESFLTIKKEEIAQPYSVTIKVEKDDYNDPDNYNYNEANNCNKAQNDNQADNDNEAHNETDKYNKAHNDNKADDDYNEAENEKDVDRNIDHPDNDGTPNKKKKRLRDLNMFTITKLTEEAKIALMEKRKECAKYKKAEFKCDLCFKAFSVKKPYDNHMTRHSDEFGDVSCPYCKLRFRNKGNLQCHSLRDHSYLFACKQCPEQFTNREIAFDHQESHEGNYHVCQICVRVFRSSKSLNKHMSDCHRSELRSQKLLSDQQGNNEIPEDGPLCELCNIRFISVDMLQRHYRISPKHNNDGSKKLNLLSEDKQPRRRQTGKIKPVHRSERIITCPECGTQVAGPRAYFNHFRYHHRSSLEQGKYKPLHKHPVMCDVCGKSFNCMANLKNHSLVHEGKKPYRCDTCGKSFTMKFNLKAHLSTHDVNKKTYPCEVCGKHMTSAPNLARHMITHSTVRPHKCDKCDKTFVTRSDKQNHYKHKHLRIPYPRKKKGAKGKAKLDDAVEEQMST